MIIPLGYGQANFIYTGAGLPTGGQVTLGFLHAGSDLNALEAAVALSGLWIEHIVPKQVNDITLSQVHIKYGPNLDGQEADVFPAVAGGDAGDDHSPQVALLVRKVTGQGGRFNRGRMYIPGLNESMVDTGGTIDTSERDAWQGAFNDFFDEMELLDLFPAVLHSEGSPATEPTQVTSFAVDGRAATQRRRLRR